jgi:hypothetical protein
MKPFRPFSQNMKGLMEYVSQDDVKRAKELIVKAIRED